jgi:hypothetical protein
VFICFSIATASRSPSDGQREGLSFGSRVHRGFRRESTEFFVEVSDESHSLVFAESAQDVRCHGAKETKLGVERQRVELLGQCLALGSVFGLGSWLGLFGRLRSDASGLLEMNGFGPISNLVGPQCDQVFGELLNDLVDFARADVFRDRFQHRADQRQGLFRRGAQSISNEGKELLSADSPGDFHGAVLLLKEQVAKLGRKLSLQLPTLREHDSLFQCVQHGNGCTLGRVGIDVTALGYILDEGFVGGVAMSFVAVSSPLFSLRFGNGSSVGIHGTSSFSKREDALSR